MIAPFNTHLKGGKAKKSTPNPTLASALLSKAKNRIQFAKDSKLSEKSASFIFEDAYEAAREAAQALMSAKGFKPYSHDATISFLKDFYPKDFSVGELSQFDRLRKLRNDSAYRAKDVSVDDAKDTINFSSSIIEKVKRLLV